MSTEIKKCSDCRFSAPTKLVGAGRWDYAKCCHPAGVEESNEKWHLGEESLSYRYCSSMRIGGCGKAATLFEPRSAPK